MSPLPRRVPTGDGAVVFLLLTLCALPSLLRNGHPSSFEATTAEPSTVVESLDVSTLPDRQYPSRFGAVPAATDRPDRSEPDFRCLIEMPGAFAHWPFDEPGAFRSQARDAMLDDTANLPVDGVNERMEVGQL